MKEMMKTSQMIYKLRKQGKKWKDILLHTGGLQGQYPCMQNW